ncbi:MAG: pyridoxal phosphate-dependent aminotransferase [Syntrophaceae bacterium]|nr:pyridoxal phosphate-dependent aminotransferase [Syntrophaceae bacterium]
MAKIALRAGEVPYSRIRELAEEAMKMEGVVKLYFGESNIPTPDFIKQAACRALEEGYTFYSENAGLPGLRRDLAAYYRRLQGVELDPDSEIVITASGVQALNLAIRCAIDPGDGAILLTPAWPNATSTVLMDCGNPHEVRLQFRSGRYRVDFQSLEEAVTPRTRLLVYTSPSNPLGWVATEEEQEGLLDFARRHDLWLLADEVYDRIYYRAPKLGIPAPSILRKARRDDAVMVAQSFSKTYCMTGWRVGWIVVRRDVGQKAAQLNEFIVSHAASFTQRAAQAALAQGEEEIKRMLGRYKANRDFCLGMLSEIPGVSVPSPDGAFYLFPKIEGLKDSFDFCRRLLHETKVGLAPGVAFGAGGEGSVRICYAADRSILEEGMEKFVRFLRGK